MKQVDQTIFGPQGNCLSACIASVLHLSVADVPCFWSSNDDENGGDEWWGRMEQWLLSRGWYPFPLAIDNPLDPEQTPNGYYIITGRAKNDTTMHSVVACGTVIVHDPDPQPTRNGLDTREWFMLLIPLDPGEWTRKQAYGDEP